MRKRFKIHSAYQIRFRKLKSNFHQHFLLKPIHRMNSRNRSIIFTHKKIKLQKSRQQKNNSTTTGSPRSPRRKFPLFSDFKKHQHKTILIIRTSIIGGPVNVFLRIYLRWRRSFAFQYVRTIFLRSLCGVRRATRFCVD